MFIVVECHVHIAIIVSITNIERRKNMSCQKVSVERFTSSYATHAIKHVARAHTMYRSLSGNVYILIFSTRQSKNQTIPNVPMNGFAVSVYDYFNHVYKRNGIHDATDPTSGFCTGPAPKCARISPSASSGGTFLYENCISISAPPELESKRAIS